ncbi:MAG: transketolase C-terminal domain-containing protein [Patescibacteria group bacterium]
MELNKNLYKKNIDVEAMRAGWGDGLLELGKKHKEVVGMCADLVGSLKMVAFAKEFPDRFIEVGIQEQNMMSAAAGLVASGLRPYIGSFSAFCPGRNWEQLRVSVCYAKAPVVFCGSHAGISVGPDGASHQAMEDIAITRCLPNLTVIAPCDYMENYKATMSAYDLKAPVYIRFSRIKAPNVTVKKTPFKIGRAEVLKSGKDVTIIACGLLVYEALIAAKELEKENINAEVINCHTIKPLDEKTIIKSAAKTGAVVSAEEHQIIGGLGSAVAEALAKNKPTPQEFVGMQGTFGESGEPDELLEKYGMKAVDIIKAVKKVKK